MFADINHFVHISHHLPSYVTLTRLGNTINNTNQEYSELKSSGQGHKVEMHLFAGSDLNFSELISLKDEQSGWTPEFSTVPSSPNIKHDRDSGSFNFSDRVPDGSASDINY